MYPTDSQVVDKQKMKTNDALLKRERGKPKCRRLRKAKVKPEVVCNRGGAARLRDHASRSGNQSMPNLFSQHLLDPTQNAKCPRLCAVGSDFEMLVGERTCDDMI